MANGPRKFFVYLQYTKLQYDIILIQPACHYYIPSQPACHYYIPSQPAYHYYKPSQPSYHYQ